MKSKNGIFVAVVGVACIVLSKSSIFQVEIHPGLGIREEMTLVTFFLLAVGITFLLIGAYKFTQADN